ncbi:RNA polymerase sigma factor SigY [Paenibacillus chungangensis]|uniref:RNA polymerase sigma factor n=1 Tax=Paenibacillus chungangensis TaxID=696535 RepID=A0ABW3HWS8_9BACL
MREAKRGQQRSLAELVQRNYSFLYHYALKLTMDKERAQDLTQETLLKAIERIGSFQAQSKFSTWLIAIASRLVIDRSRRIERERRWMQEEQQALRKLRYESMQRMGDWPEALQALGQLEERIRMPVLLKYYYGYSQEEIADMLEVPTGTVKSRLHTGLKQLRKELADDE